MEYSKPGFWIGIGIGGLVVANFNTIKEYVYEIESFLSKSFVFTKELSKPSDTPDTADTPDTRENSNSVEAVDASKDTKESLDSFNFKAGSEAILPETVAEPTTEKWTLRSWIQTPEPPVTDTFQIEADPIIGRFSKKTSTISSV